METPSHRRDFVRTVMVAGTTGWMAAPEAGADEPKDDSKAADQAKVTPDEAEARMQLILARFGRHEKIDDAARKAIREEVAAIVSRAEALRKFTLTNGDGPLPVFTPYRGGIA